MEDARHYADEEALYVSGANRADGEPATEDDANAYVIQRNWQGHHSAKPVINRWKKLGFTPPRTLRRCQPSTVRPDDR